MRLDPPPTTPPLTVPNNSVGFNGLISVPDYGLWAIRVIEISYDVTILSKEDTAANYKVFYPLNVLSSDFGIIVSFVSYEEREKFLNWMTTYLRKIASGNIKVNGYMTVSVPGRKFVRKGVFSGTLTYGEEVGQIRWGLVLGFIGATSPIGESSTSKFVKAPVDHTSDLYYPAGTQLDGLGTYEGTIFNNTPTTSEQVHADYSELITTGVLGSDVSFEDYYKTILGIAR